MSRFQGPWLILGDFNAVLGSYEKLGGIIPHSLACSEFLHWTNVNDLIHLNTQGLQYTWTNRREGKAYIAQRLDRAICNEQWLTHWSISTCNTLSKYQSDHAPLLMTLEVTPLCLLFLDSNFTNSGRIMLAVKSL
jgi:endonuclease/exonuclease/phosphatase family metal-dependent hydrolase